MSRAVRWGFGVVVGLPAAVIAFGILRVFVFYPVQHAWNVHRMDAKNAGVWEDANASVVTVEAELGTKKGVETLKTEIVCYKGYYARAWSPKSGPPETGLAATSIGFEALQAELPSGGTLDISLRSLCSQVDRVDWEKLPVVLTNNGINIVAPDLSLYCRFGYTGAIHEFALQTDAVWVGYPYVTAIEERPLRTLASLSEMGSSDSPFVSSAFAQRWEGSIGKGHGRWKSREACWTDQLGLCHEALTNQCGRIPSSW